MAKGARLQIPEPYPERLREATELAAQAAEPAVVEKIRLGTAGWTDKTLIQCGQFYPRGVSSPRDRLEFYARSFRLVEVDATYYSLLPVESAQHWAEWTPQEFRFDVKAYPVLTGHPLDIARLPGDLRPLLEQQGFKGRVYPKNLPDDVRLELESRFRSLLEPLRAAGKLGAVFVQFPPWFASTRGNVRDIESLAERWSGVALAVEFRHPSWLSSERRDRVLDLLRRLKLSYVCVDEPQLAKGTVPPVIAVTNSELAVIRFHGKNASGWATRGATVHERFDYLYSSAELSQWIEPVRRLSQEAETVHAIFNNCVRNYAVLNAKGFGVLLQENTKTNQE